MSNRTDHTKTPTPWERGLPPGPYYPGMEHDFEVHFTPGGLALVAPQDRRHGGGNDPDGNRP